MLNGGCFATRVIVPQSFDECLTYGQRQAWMGAKIKELDERVSALEQQNKMAAQEPEYVPIGYDENYGSYIYKKNE